MNRPQALSLIPGLVVLGIAIASVPFAFYSINNHLYLVMFSLITALGFVGAYGIFTFKPWGWVLGEVLLGLGLVYFTVSLIPIGVFIFSISLVTLTLIHPYYAIDTILREREVNPDHVLRGKFLRIMNGNRFNKKRRE
jgi:hypothetical protein